MPYSFKSVGLQSSKPEGKETAIAEISLIKWERKEYN